MPTVLKPGGLRTRSIIVQTREGHDVENMQSLELPYAIVDKYPGHQLIGRPGVRAHRGPTGVYNCHGLTFASRRTQITAASAINLVLRDDNYVEVEASSVRPGDIAVYRGEDGDVEHSGVVVSVPPDPPMVPTILSKWGTGHEVIHPANMCPYTVSFVSYYRQN